MKKTKKINWGQSYFRRFSIHKLDVYLLHMEKELKKIFPRGMSNLLGIGKKHEVRWYFDDAQFQELGEMVLKKTLKDAKTRNNHIIAMVNQAARGVKKVNDFNRVNFSKFGSVELRRAFIKFLKAVDDSIPIIYAPLPIDNQLFEYTKKLLSRSYAGRVLENNFDIIITPVEPIPIVQLDIDLLKILKKKQKGELLKNDLERIRKKYCWLSMRFVDNQPVTIEDFYKYLLDLKRKNWNKQLLDYKKEFELRRKRFNKAILLLKPEEKRFLKLVNQYSALRHQRDTYRGSVYYYGHSLYREIKRRFKISTRELFTYTVDETKKLIENGERLDRKEVESREKHFVYLLIRGKRRIFSQPKEIKEIIEDQLKEQKAINQKEEINGQVACSGRVRGRVRIIHLNVLYEDLRRFKEGEIMVTASTKPEYVSGMKKAAAIITDEGGITCHAAIVSRELKIPCIIGTKIATKVLKDGQLVEVDANKGIVKIIRK